MKTAAILQARFGSKRLPGKVLADLAGAPMLARILDRASAITRVDRCVVTTSDESSDDQLAAFCDREDLACFRGPVDDIVTRLVGAAKLADAEVVVRLWGDCPFIDPAIVDEAMARVAEEKLDYVTAADWDEPRTLPVGLDFEIYRTALLERMDSEIRDGFLREFPYEFVAAHRDSVRSAQQRHQPDLSHLCLTVDYPADLDLARSVYERLKTERAPHSLSTLLPLLTQLDTRAPAPRNQEYLEKKAQRT